MIALHRHFALLTGAMLLAAAGPASGQVYEDCTEEVSEAVQLTAEANRWLDDAGAAGLVLVKEEDGVGFQPLGAAGASGISSFSYSSGDYRVSFGLRGEVGAQNVTLDLLRTRFRYFVVDSLPLPGFRNIAGWEVRPQTPRSSFSDGVEFTSFSDGRVTLRVRTSFFAIYGFNRLILSQVPADAPSPEGSTFQVRRSFPLDLTLTAAIAR